MYSLRIALCGFQRAGALYNSILAAFLKGDDGGGDTPLPIPNREVKPASADGTAGETPWESRSSPISHSIAHFSEQSIFRLQAPAKCYLGCIKQAFDTLPVPRGCRPTARYGCCKIPAKRRHTRRLVLGERPCGRWDIQKHRSRSHCVLQRRGVRDRHNLAGARDPVARADTRLTLEPFERIAR